MRTAREIWLGGVLWDPANWRNVSVTREGPNVSVRLRPTDPREEITLGTSIEVRLGRRTGAGAGAAELITIARGTVEGQRRAEAWMADAMEYAIDASDARLRDGPPARVTHTNKGLRELLEAIYTVELGYAGVETNLRDYTIPSFVITPAQSYHAAAQSLLTGFTTKAFFEPLTGAWCIWDTRRPIPATTPMRDLPVSAVLTYEGDSPARSIVNQVEISYVDEMPSGSVYTEREISIDADKPPNGHPLGKSWRRVHEYREDPDNPGRVTYEANVGARSQDYDATGELVGEQTTTITYVPNTFDQLVLSEVTQKRARVRLGSGFEFIRVKRQTTYTVWWHDAAADEWVKQAVYTRTEGEILEPDRVALDEGSREHTSGVGARQTTRWGDLEHGHTLYHETGAGVLELGELHDDLLGGVKYQLPRVTNTQVRYKVERPVKKYLHTDDASIALYGRRPVVPFDGTPYGLETSKEIVDEQIFGGWAGVDRTATAHLLLPDPTWYDGLLARYTDREGATSAWLVASVTDTDDYAGRSTETVLSLLRVEVV